MRCLVAGWFSFEQMGATAGDLLTRDLVCEWLEQAGLPHDVALAAPFPGGVDWSTVPPEDYSHVLFVCGPFGNGKPVDALLRRFAGRRFIGVNLSMLESLDTWDPFDLLLERDSSRASRPDLAFLTHSPRVPVVGLVLVHPQSEYQRRALHGVANDAIRRLLDSYEAAVVPIDTRLDANSTGLRSPAEVDSLIARMDVVVTTRLHGTVLAIKNGIPAVAVDPIAGGAKLRRQAESIGWPIVFGADSLTDGALRDAISFCLTEPARVMAKQCAERAVTTLQGLKDSLIDGIFGISGNQNAAPAG